MHIHLIKGVQFVGMKIGSSPDEFFFDNPEIADKYGFVTCYKGEPIGFICWDPRNRPEYVEIGHNGIRTKYKRRGFGKAQLSEAVRRIKEYKGLKEIRVWTNSNLIAPKNYEKCWIYFI